MARASRLRAWPLACALALASLTGAASAKADGVAVIDVQGAVRQTEDGIRAQATLKKLFDKRQQELDARQNQLRKVQQEIEKQRAFLSREALSKRIEVWQRDMIQLQSTFVDYEKELQKKQAELTAPILQRLMALVARVAKQGSYDLVIDRQAAPYARPDIDLTDRVVQLYNAGETG